MVCCGFPSVHFSSHEFFSHHVELDRGSSMPGIVPIVASWEDLPGSSFRTEAVIGTACGHNTSVLFKIGKKM